MHADICNCVANSRICTIYFKIYHIAGIAQLGERQTEDLKVACSIHAHRKFFTTTTDHVGRGITFCRYNFFFFFLTLCQCLLLFTTKFFFSFYPLRFFNLY